MHLIFEDEDFDKFIQRSGKKILNEKLKLLI